MTERELDRQIFVICVDRTFSQKSLAPKRAPRAGLPFIAKLGGIVVTFYHSTSPLHPFTIMPFSIFAFPSKDRKTFHGMATRSKAPFNIKGDRGAFVKAVDEKGNFVRRSKRLGTPTKSVLSPRPHHSTPKKSPAARQGGVGRVLFASDEAKPAVTKVESKPAINKKESTPPSVDDLCGLFSRTKISINDKPSPNDLRTKCLSSMPSDGRYVDLVETRDPELYTPVKRCVRFRDA